MEEYLQYMKTLRCQMNDVEDQAAKASVEEQMQITTMELMEKDLNLAKLAAKQLKEDTTMMMNIKGQICSQILEKQGKIASFESDIATLTQALELIQQDRSSLSTKIVEKSSYYLKIAEDINTKLQKQQNWATSNKISNKISREMEQHGQMKDKITGQYIQVEGSFSSTKHLTGGNMDNDARTNLMAKLESETAKLDAVVQMKSKVATENVKIKQSIDHVKSYMNDYKSELLTMDIALLEKEYNALLSDKSRESEYLQSLMDQINKLKGISHIIRCCCGEEYKVDMDLHV